jgi:hypothetical protein
MKSQRNGTSWFALGLSAWGLLALAACDFSVTNPGPVADGYLDSVTARRALVTGARRALAGVLAASPPFGYGLAYWSGAQAFEINPAGSTGSFGIPPWLQAGTLRADANTWSSAQQARWVAEDAIRRFKQRGFVEDSLFSVLYLWAGYANRLLGENFCDAVFDGGPKEDFKNFFTRAEGHFTEALRIANALPSGSAAQVATRNKLIRAASAGRASVRMALASYNKDNAKWAAAVADAQAVPDTFRWQMPYYDQDLDQYNALYWSQANSPYRAHTTWATYYENYYRVTRDPRVPWDTTNLLGDAAVQKFSGYPGVVNNRVPFWPQAKYKARNAPVNLSSGWEMRLIEAEYELAVNSNAANAVAKMNLRRANLGLPLLTVTTLTQAWTDLKRERMLELWLEARRLGDLRRWKLTNTPGTEMDGVWVTGEATPRETMSSRDLCWPIGQNEIETNPNLKTP